MKEKILIIEDEIAICELLKMELEMEGYVVQVSNDGNEGLNKFNEFKPDLILLDLMLPGLNGFDVCKVILSKHDIPIIMLTAKADIVDKVVGLELGADDYITKPFDMRELLARVKALIRRSKIGNVKRSNIYQNGKLVLNPISMSAKINDNELHLTPKEYNILFLFVNNMEKVYTREDLVEKIWHLDYNADTRTVDMHIQRIRKKIANFTEDKYIETVFGAGYKMRKIDEV